MFKDKYIYKQLSNLFIFNLDESDNDEKDGEHIEPDRQRLLSML